MPVFNVPEPVQQRQHADDRSAQHIRHKHEFTAVPAITEGASDHTGDGVDLSLLNLLIRPNGYTPDFLTPPPDEPFPSFLNEIARVRSVPPEVIRTEVAYLYPVGKAGSERAQVFFDHPLEALDQLVEEMTVFWERTLAPHWPRLTTLLEGDVLYRAHQLAFGGPSALFSNLHDSIRYDRSEIVIDKQHQQLVDTGGRGLLLIPVAFAWPDLYVITDGLWQPTIAYAPRGLAGLWTFEHVAMDSALRALVGETRARLLHSLLTPTTTGELARKLHLTDGAISQHLGKLQQAGLVEALRQRKHSYYRLSAIGRALLQLYGLTE